MGFLPLVIAAALSAAQPLTVHVSGSGYVQLAAAAAGTFRVTIANSKPSNCANDAKAGRAHRGGAGLIIVIVLLVACLYEYGKATLLQQTVPPSGSLLSRRRNLTKTLLTFIFFCLCRFSAKAAGKPHDC